MLDQITPGVALLTIVIFTGFGFALNGGWLIVQGVERRKGALMLVMAAVLISTALVSSV
ncbi:MAG: hypothetical protein K2P79_11960 [Sphingomonas sp.]|nr:hypothetical protein [Sphingomonas sp.]